MVSTFYPPYNFGGDGMQVYRLSNALARRGHSVDVFHCEDAFLLLNKRAPDKEDFPSHPLVKVHRLKSGTGFLSPLLAQQTGVAFFKSDLKNALETRGYDVIHFHNMSLIGITALGYGSAIKLYTTHEHWLVCPTHVLWKFNSEVCAGKSCFKCQLKAKRPPQLWRNTDLIKKMLRRVDCVLAPSRFTLEKHRAAGLDVRLEHLPHFLPASAAKTANSEKTKSPERSYFLFVGRLEQIKGAQNLIPVFRKLPQYDLLIAGEGDYHQNLENQASDCPNIKFLGRVDQNRLHSLYQAAVAVVVPSICYETFGLIVIEAFARKTPVIVNRLGALPELIEESGGGFIYNNQNELTDAVECLAENSALRDEIGNKGCAAFLKYWCEDAHLSQYLELIGTLREQRAEKLNSPNRAGYAANAV